VYPHLSWCRWKRPVDVGRRGKGLQRRPAQKRSGANAAGAPKHARTSDKPAGAFGSVEELRRSLAAFQANEQAQFARPVPQQQSTQTDHFLTNPGAPQGVGSERVASGGRAGCCKEKTTGL
jgi:hypothetical protein